MPAVLYRAAVVCPMSAPPIADGGVLVDGDTIAAVGPAAGLRADADREHVVDGVVLPGLVNGHTQVEHADAFGLTPANGTEHFTAWLAQLEATTAAWDGERWAGSARRGVQQVLRAGATTTGDVVTSGPGVPASGRAGLAGDSWVEVAAVDERDRDAVLAAVERALRLPGRGRRVGIAPRGAYSLDTVTLQALADLSRRVGAPLRTRVAQSAAEAAAIRHGSGPLAERARARGLRCAWLQGGTGLSPVRYLDLFRVLGPTTTLAHGTWVSEDDVGLLADRDVAMVCCPRSDGAFGGAAPLEWYAGCGVRLALGTDSPAAAPGFDLLAEAAAWAGLARRRGLTSWPGEDGPVDLDEQALRLATCAGAAALGWGATSGCLEAGRRADLVALAVTTTPAQVHRDVLRAGLGRQLFTVLAGVRATRRADADEPWPDVDHRAGPSPADGRRQR